MSAAIAEIFLITLPGLEQALLQEAREKGFRNPRAIAGGVVISGGWPDVWRANLELRGASRVLARIGSFRAAHLAELDKKARAFPWKDHLRADVPVKVEATCRASRIYHSGAAAERIARAISEELGAKLEADAALLVKARIEKDVVTLSLDASGELLHKRGHKAEVAKAPLRETMAAMFLRQCGFDGNEPVLDPMCGSGTFVIEAAEIAARLAPGRNRDFAFTQLKSFDAQAWNSMRAEAACGARMPSFTFHGRDIDAGAVRMSRANATRAGVEAFTRFDEADVAGLAPPEGPPGLVIVNPPYGARIGKSNALKALHIALGRSLLSRFRGWRVGLVTSNEMLARATGLPFGPAGEPVAHGGLKVRLWQASL